MTRRWNLRLSLYIATAVVCSLSLTFLTVTPPGIPTDWALLNAWGIYVPQRVDYPWPSYAVQVALWLMMTGALVAASRQSPEKDKEEKRNAVPTGGFAQQQRDRETERKSSKKPQHEIWILALMTLVGFGLRLHGLQDLPLIVDEIGFAAHASDILHGQFVPIFAPGHNANPSVYAWLVAGAMSLFGQNTFAIRLIPLVFGTLSIPAMYILGREWWSRRVGLIAAAFLATYPAHIFYSRMSLYNIVDPFFAMLALAFLGRALKSPLRREYWIFAGMMAGIAQYFYHGSRLVLVLMAVYVVLSLSWKREKRISEGQRNRAAEKKGFDKFSDFLAYLASWRLSIFWIALAFAVMVLPRFAPMLVNRLPMTGNEQAMRLPLDLGINSLRATLAWVGQKDLSPFWMSDAPLLQWPALIAFGIGLVVSVWRWRDARYAALVLSVILTTIFGGAIWTSAPLYVRYMTAIPAIALLVAVGIEKIICVTQFIRGMEKQRTRYMVSLQIMLVLVMCGQGIWAEAAQITEAKGQIQAELWEEDKLAKLAADLPSGTAAVLIASAGFGAKPPDPRVMEAIGIAHYVAAYGERRAVVLNWDGGKILKAQLRKLNLPYMIVIANGEKIF
jgi:4-amino-4-deoxy-L-arabinose transferase-like glycosyltransferase